VLKLQQMSAPQRDLAALLSRLRQSSPSWLTWLHVGAGNTTRVLSVDEVLYFQAGDKYTEVVTATGRHVIRTALKELTKRLNEAQFAQIHRATIVNLQAIERVERDMLGRALIHLKNRSDVLTISRAYLSHFKQM
jgi:DNA-binding LytR/AlgR family response regulator